MSNKTFNIRRFGLLLQNDILLNSKTYLFTCIGSFIGFYILSFFYLRRSFFLSPEMHYHMPVIFYFVSLLILAGLSFPAMRYKKSTANYLLLPASAFEKYLSQILIRFVAGVLLSMLIFWLAAHAARWSAMQTETVKEYLAMQGREISRFEFSQFFNMVRVENTDYILKTVSYLAMAAVFTFLFSIRLFFKRFSLIKTTISGIAILFLLIKLIEALSKIFFPQNNSLPTYYISETIGNTELLICGIMLIVWISSSIIGYFKLKEKEI